MSFKVGQHVKFRFADGDDWYDGVFKGHTPTARYPDYAIIYCKNHRYRIEYKSIKSASELGEENPNITFRAKKDEDLRKNPTRRRKSPRPRGGIIVKEDNYMSAGAASKKVRKLREITGAGVSDCAKALKLKDWSIPAASAYIQVERKLKKAREGRM